MTQTAITKTFNAQPLAVVNQIMQAAGQAANKAAAARAFTSALAGRADNTTRRKRADLALFETYLQAAGVPAAGLYDSPAAWQGVTWGIIEGFKVWMLKQGYAMASINGRLSTVRNHAGLANKAGAIDDIEARMIASVKGYTHKEARNIDAKRKDDGMQTRKGSKKSEAVTIAADQAAAMIAQPNSPQGRRDNLLMCLLLEHGLRVSEVAILTTKSFNLKEHKLIFYRPKVDITQTINLSKATREAAAAYIAKDAPAAGIIWRKSHKGTAALSGQLSEDSATRALTKRVELLGRKAGVMGLSAHDCRHYWATYEANKKTPVNRLMQAGGWNSPAMPLRYIAQNEIANEGTAKGSE